MNALHHPQPPPLEFVLRTEHLSDDAIIALQEIQQYLMGLGNEITIKQIENSPALTVAYHYAITGDLSNQREMILDVIRNTYAQGHWIITEGGMSCQD